MGAKDALCKIKDMHFGLPDKLGYYEPACLAGFKKTIASNPESLAESRFSRRRHLDCHVGVRELLQYEDRAAENFEMLNLLESNDIHKEQHQWFRPGSS